MAFVGGAVAVVLRKFEILSFFFSFSSHFTSRVVNVYPSAQKKSRWWNHRNSVGDSLVNNKHPTHTIEGWGEAGVEGGEEVSPVVAV